MVDWRNDGLIIARIILSRFQGNKFGQRVKHLMLDNSRSFIRIRRPQDFQREVIQGQSNFARYVLKVKP